MTTPHTQQPQEHSEHSPLSVSVLSRIEKENVMQTPRWKFLLFEYGMWVLWALSVVIGAISFSAMLLIFMHAGFAFKEGLQQDMLEFTIEVLPYAWALLFILMAVLAHYNLRHTKRGYTYPLWQIVLSSFVLSLIGGAVLHSAGIGLLIDAQAGRIPLFMNVEKLETKMWLAPEEGRLVGMYEREGDDSYTVQFRDKRGGTWTLDTAELNPIDKVNLFTGDEVRIMGVLATSSDRYFHGCAVFPGPIQHEFTLQDMQHDRLDFIRRMEAHHERVFLELQQATNTVPADHPMVCAHSGAFLKLRGEFQMP